MYMVEPSHKIKEITAMYDTEKNEVVCYLDIEEGGWYRNYDNERYFNTREQAESYRANRQNQLRAKFGEVKAFIKEMQDTDKEFFEHTDEDYMGKYAPISLKPYYKDYMRERKRSEIYRDIITTGYINLNAESFRIKDVVHIKWYKNNKAAIFLGEAAARVDTANEFEYSIIEELFGYNKSEMQYQL